MKHYHAEGDSLSYVDGYCYMLLWIVICGYIGLWVVIEDYRLLYVVMGGYMWLWVVI